MCSRNYEKNQWGGVKGPPKTFKMGGNGENLNFVLVKVGQHFIRMVLNFRDLIYIQIRKLRGATQKSGDFF